MNKYVIDFYTEKGGKANKTSMIAGILVGLVFLITGVVLFFVIKELGKKIFAIFFALVGAFVFATSIITIIASSKRAKIIDDLIKNGKCVEADIIGVKIDRRMLVDRIECSYSDSFGNKKDYISDDIHENVNAIIEKLKIKKIPVYYNDTDYFVDIRIIYDSVVDLTK